MKIVSKDKGLITLPFYDYQRKIVSLVHDNRFVLVECARQSGKTTALTAYILYYILFNEHKTVALLANKGDTSREILGRIKLAYERLPKWLQLGVVKYNEGTLILENGSKIIATATSSDNIRGFAIDVLVIDEAAHIDGWDDFWTSIAPTISSGTSTKVVLISTVNGMNHFHKFTSKARKGENEFKLISVSWQQVPGRDEAWKQSTIQLLNGDMDKFAQEYENEYLGSSGTLISGWKLKDLMDGDHIVDPIFNEFNIFQYERPKKDHQYVCIVDVSRGKGLDHSAFQMIDITSLPYKQVCTFRDNITTPSDFAEIIDRIGRSYNEAFVLIEVNDLGQQVAEIMFHDYEYPGILNTENKGRLGKRVTTAFGTTEKCDRGIRTTTPVKRIGCAMLKLIIESGKLLIKDRHTVEELTTFIKKEPSYAAEPGKHDDLVMGLVLFAWLSDQPFFKEITDISTLKSIRDRDSEEFQSVAGPLSYVTNGVNDVVVKEVRGGDVWTTVGDVRTIF